MPRQTILLACALVALLAHRAAAERFSVEQDEDGVTVTLDGKLLTRYLIKSGHKPILWPVIGPTGKPVTRSYPMTEGTADERKDHIHHRSFWLTHGNVNGVDFWAESEKSGHIVHREFCQVSGGEQAVISTINDWVAPGGKKLCQDERTLTFGADGESRWIDLDITVTANQDLTFGDTKEGTFGVRVAGTMKVTAEKGGMIVNAKGDKNQNAWGKPAPWVDYYGPVDGETVGIAILNHPSSFRFPTHWHVRTYGLFAANPFGLHDFYGKDKKVDGSHRMKAGDSFVLSYRVLLHRGDTKQGEVEKAFEQYAKTKRSGRK